MTKPASDLINWDDVIFLDPTTGTDPFATSGIPIPTYGNYGGPGYTAGTLGGTTPDAPSPAPADALDALFYQHDLVFQKVNDGVLPPTVAIAATVDLILKMSALTYTDPGSPDYDPAAGLYEGLATLGLVSQVLVSTNAWNFLDAETQGAIAAATQEAVTNFEAGLAAIPGEAGSLHGAFNVFEHKLASSLPFDLMF